MPTYAVIDVGTNTVRLLVAEADTPDVFRLLYEEQAMTRLGEGLVRSGSLQEEAMARTTTVLRRLTEIARRYRVQAMDAVATSAVREAANARAFIARVQEEATLPLRMISAQEEARLTTLGISHAMGFSHERFLMMDIGGGSTEYAFAEGSILKAAVSTDLGTVKLTERYLHSDPPRTDELRSLTGTIRTRLRELQPSLPDLTGTSLVGTAGTVTTLAAIDLGLSVYDRRKVNGHRLSFPRVRELFHRLAGLQLDERRRVPGLEAGRADIIVAGAAVVCESLEGLGYPFLRVSDGGLREGLLLDFLRQKLLDA